MSWLHRCDKRPLFCLPPMEILIRELVGPLLLVLCTRVAISVGEKLDRGFLATRQPCQPTCRQPLSTAGFLLFSFLIAKCTNACNLMPRDPVFAPRRGTCAVAHRSAFGLRLQTDCTRRWEPMLDAFIGSGDLRNLADEEKGDGPHKRRSQRGWNRI